MNFTPVFVVTLQDVIGFSLLGLILLVAIIYSMFNWIKQSLCKHNQGVWENGLSLDCTCKKCGKDLGFVGSYKERYNIK